MSLHDTVRAVIGRGLEQEAIYTRLPGVNPQRIDKAVDGLIQGGHLVLEAGKVRPRQARRCTHLHLEEAIALVRGLRPELIGLRDAATGEQRQDFDRRVLLLDLWVEIGTWLLDQDRQEQAA